MIFIRRVVGDSMLPSLKPGDVVVAKKSSTYKNGDLIVAKVNGREIIKRIKSKTNNGFYEIVGENSNNSTDSRHFGAIKQSNIKGKVFFRLRPKKRLIVAMILIIVFGILSIFTYLMYINGNNLVRFDNGVSAKTPTYNKNFTLGSITKDLDYCGDQTLDIYQPRKALYESQPVVIYVHGGGWHINDKSSDKDQLSLIDGLRDNGFAIISINYRSVPEYGYPAQIQDTLCSIRYIRSNATALNINPEKIGIFGFSAGGHLAAMAGVLDSKSKFNNGEYIDNSSRVGAVATIAGVFDFKNELKQNSQTNIKNMMLTYPLEDAAPINYVSSDDPPFLLIHGNKDNIVKTNQDILFSNKLLENNVPVEKLIVENADHSLKSVGLDISPSKNQISKQIKQFYIDKLNIEVI